METLVEPAKEDYAFTGWYTDSTYSTSVDLYEPMTFSKDIYPGWEEEKFDFEIISPASVDFGTFAASNIYQVCSRVVIKNTGNVSFTLETTSNDSFSTVNHDKHHDVAPGEEYEFDIYTVKKSVSTTGSSEYKFRLIATDASETETLSKAIDVSYMVVADEDAYKVTFYSNNSYNQDLADIMLAK